MPLSDASSYPLWLNVAIFAAAAAIVWMAGTRLTQQVDAIAQHLGLEQAFAGMLLLGGITSLPEVANVATSAYAGNPTLAVNNLLGSASINIVLLAAADALIGREALTAIVAQPAALMQAALCMLVLTLVAVAVSSGDVAVYGVGMWSVALAAASIASFWLSWRYGRRAPWRLAGNDEAEASAAGDPAHGPEHGRLGRRLAKLSLAAAVILAAGYALAQTGDALAGQTGLGSGMVGFLLLGLATSMPEVSTIFAALRMRRAAMALGEVLGTNFINISLILLADLLFTGGPVIDRLGSFEIVSALLGVLLTGVYLVGLLEHRDSVVLRMGYDSFAVLVLFIGGVALLFSLRLGQ